MKSLARRFVAQLVVAAMLAAQWPASAWAGPAGSTPAPNLPTPMDQRPGYKAEPSEVLAYFRKIGVIKGDNDPLKDYLGTDQKLTPIGKALFLSMIKRYNDVEEVETLAPAFEKIRKAGPYSENRQTNVANTVRNFEEKFGALSETKPGTIEESYRAGAMREAVMNGATVADPAPKNAYMQVATKDGFEFWDREGLAFRMTKNQVTTYNRELQKTQRLMNLNRPPEVPEIPETGRYNYEMLQYSYYRLKAQEKEYVRAQKVDRMIAMAELLGVQLPNDAWFDGKSDKLEADLIAQARAKTYTHRNQTYSVFDIVDAKFEQRRYYIAGSTTAVARFEQDMVKFKESGTITDAQVATMSLHEQSALRWLSLTVLETQMFHIRSQREKVDPTSPDAQMVMKIIDETEGLTPEERANYKLRGVEMKDRLESLRLILEDVRNKLRAADYSGSLDMVQAALGSTQKELAELSTDYAIYLEAPSTAYMAKLQGYDGYNPIKHGIRGFWRLVDGGYRADMNAIEGRNGERGIEAKYLDIARLIAKGDKASWAHARRTIIAMNPGSEQYVMSTNPTGDVPKPNDALRISTSLKVAHERIGRVTEKNKTLDAVSSFVTMTVALALLAPVARGFLNLTGRMSGPGFKLITAGTELGFVKGMGHRLLGRSMVVVGEISKHTASRLKSLEPGASRLTAETAVVRYLQASGMRAVNVAARQASFTALSGVISGMFTVGTHYYDQATGGHSMFQDDFADPENNGVLEGGGLWGDGARKAFWTGAKGGMWWANESFHPMLGYVGLPSTVFANSRFAGAMEVVGSRGVIGSTVHGLKVMKNGSAAVEAAAAQRTTGGLLERMMESKWYTGKPLAAFTLSMADNVAKYALFSHAAGWLGEKYGYHFRSRTVGNMPPLTEEQIAAMTPEQLDERYRDETERRIKVSKKTGQAWLESPAWLLIPTHAAHAAAESAPYMRSKEGAKMYDQAGRTKEYLSKANGELVDFIKPPKPPLSQAIFEAKFFGDPPPTKWAMTEQIRRAGIRKELVRMLAGPDGKIESINPLEFYRMTKLKDNQRFVNVHMNDEVRLVAHQDFVDALLARPDATKRALEAKPGEIVQGLGRITPELQLDIAVALYTAEGMAGKKMPASLSQGVNKLLGPYLEANQVVQPFAEAFMKNVSKAPAKSPKIDAELTTMVESVREWGAGKGEFAGEPYSALIAKLRERVVAKNGAKELNATEAGLMTSLYDYVLAIERRFNSFNKVETVMGLNGKTIEALKVEFAGKSEVTRILDGFSTELNTWSSSRKGQAVDGPKADGKYLDLMAKFGNDLKAAESKLTPNEAAALNKAVNDMTSAPWVLHDSKGAALSSWRPAQFVSFVESLSEVASGEAASGGAAAEGLAAGPRGGDSVRLFQMLTTGGGKTMLTFEGLLPLAEADAAARKMEVTFLTVQSNLEAQARMEFIAFRKIGSKLTFDTYEGFKTKIAEGKTKGKNALKRYWILGDEMDGAALQPALTIGQVSGHVTRKNGVAIRMEEIDAGLSRILQRNRVERASNIETEARRLTTLFESLGETVPGRAEIKAEAMKLERSAGKIQSGSRQEVLTAEQSVKESMLRIRQLLEAVPSREGEVVSTAKESLGRMEKAVDRPPLTEAQRGEMLIELQNGFKEQGMLYRLVKANEGFGSLPAEAGKARLALEAKISRLERELGAASETQAKGEAKGAARKGVGLRIEGLKQELELARMEKTLVERFEAVDKSSRLMKIDEQVVALQKDLGLAPGEAIPAGAKGEKLTRLMRESAALEGSMSGEVQAAHGKHRAQLSRVLDLGAEMGKADGEVLAAVAKGDKAAETAAREKLTKLENERATARASIKSMELELGAGSSKGDLGGMMRRAQVLEADIARLEGVVESAKAQGKRAGPAEAELKTARSDAADLHRAIKKEVGDRFKTSADEILAIVQKGEPGWEIAAQRLLKQRKALLESFTAEENPMYQVYRDMKADAYPIAHNEMLLEGANKIKDSAEGLKSLAEQLAAFEKAPSGPAGEAMPFLKQASLFHGEMKARLGELEVKAKEAEASKDASQLQRRIARSEFERAQIELKLVERFLQLETPGTAPKGEPFPLAETLLKLDRIAKDGEGLTLEAANNLKRRIDGDPFLKYYPKLLWRTMTGGKMDVAETGLTRIYAQRMLKALFKEPMMDLAVRDNLMWSFVNSLLFPKGIGHRPNGSSWVRSEIINLVQGYHENPAGVRLDGRNNKFNVVHNGQWFESMDNATRRWWELEYGVDLTMPYSHQSISTIKDVTTFKGSRFISLSGTAGRQFEKHMREAGVRLIGKGSEMPGAVHMDVVGGASMKFTRIGEARVETSAVSKELVVFKPTDLAPLREIAAKGGADATNAAAVIKAVEAHLAAAKLKGGGVIEIGKVESAEAQAWLRTIRATQGDTGLVGLVISDTRMLKTVLKYLERKGATKEEITMVFSDSEYLRLNVPEANVGKQMNLDGLNTGKTKYLILDARVGGRGLDLNYKGDRGNPAPDAFRGYTNIKMLVIDPQSMSQVHLLQAMGRIDKGRVLSGAQRDFSLVMEVGALKHDAFFRNMFFEEPLFMELRRDPAVQRFAREKGMSEITLPLLHEYVMFREAQGGEGILLAERYRKVMREKLEERQAEVEADQMRSSSVSQERPAVPGKYPGLELIR